MVVLVRFNALCNRSEGVGAQPLLGGFSFQTVNGVGLLPRLKQFDTLHLSFGCLDQQGLNAYSVVTVQAICVDLCPIVQSPERSQSVLYPG
jgi:hypothetical protein